MEYLPREPEPQDKPIPLEYARPMAKQSLDTPFGVRVAGLILSVLAILLGLPLGIMAVIGCIEEMQKYRSGADLGEGARAFVLSAVLVITGVLGIRGAFRFKDRDP